MSKATKGSVVVFARGDHLHLRFRASGKPYRVALGLPDTKEGNKLARSRASQIEADIHLGQFDPTLVRYRMNGGVQPLVASSVSLVHIWQQYTQVRRNVIAETTLRVQYDITARHIAKLPPDLQTPEQAIAIRDFFMQRLSLDATIRLLQQLSKCCDWALETDLIDRNPFDGLAKKLKRSVKKKPPQDIDPFDQAEMLAIIQGFESDPCYSYYAPFVKFLFWTGCRTGEAIALQWQHVSPDCTQITFCESVSTQLRIRKTTKTGKVRMFPCSQQLQALLTAIQPDNPKPETPVFPGKRGGNINAHTFIQNAWKGGRKHKDSTVSEGVVTRLVKQGKVKRYRTQYNTRHTFITISLEKGIPPVQVARWVGNSVQTIMKHYLGLTIQTAPPEF